MINTHLKIKFNLDVDRNVLLIISFPKELEQVFITITLKLSRNFPNTRFRLAESYLSMAGMEFYEIIKIFGLIMEGIYRF